MKKLLSILAIFCLLASPAVAATKYPAPTLVNPVTITVGTGQTVTKIPSTQDAIVKLPATRKVGSTIIMGGHNVVVIGGSITVPAGDSTQRAIYIADATGTVHIEGVEVVCTKGVYFDAIAINAPLADVQIQNMRLCSDGRQDIFHGDLIQPWGGFKSLKVDSLTGFAGYQGFQLPALDGSFMGPVTLSRIDLHSTGAQVTTDGGNGGFLLWTVAGSSSCLRPVSITMSDVYLQGRAGRSPGLIAWPSNKQPSACKSAVVNNVVTFSATLPIKGTATIGKPAAEFVPLGKAGLSYKP
jgi:hypothetical protein